MNSQRMFRFSRFQLILLYSLYIILFGLVDYSIIRVSTSLKETFFWQLILLIVLGFFFFIDCFLLNKDIIYSKEGMVLIPLGWYLFRIPSKVNINFKDIYSVRLITWRISDLIIISTNKKIMLLAISPLRDYSGFIDILFSKLPSHCTKVGFEYLIKNQHRKSKIFL